MIRFSVLSSGSCGNCYVFSADGTSIMIDAGISFAKIQERLRNASIEMSDIRALFLTHLHPDHSHSAGTFSRRTGMPVYVTEKCFEYTKDSEYKALNIREDCRKLIGTSQDIAEGPFTVNAVYSSHDSAGSCCYIITVKNRKIGIITDTGYCSENIRTSFSSVDLLFLESNYDEAMLAKGPYPAFLKKRVAGLSGHLSNAQALDFLITAGFLTNRKPVYLIHLSDTNNKVEIVEQTMRSFNATVCARGHQYTGQLF